MRESVPLISKSQKKGFKKIMIFPILLYCVVSKGAVAAGKPPRTRARQRIGKYLSFYCIASDSNFIVSASAENRCTGSASPCSRTKTTDSSVVRKTRLGLSRGSRAAQTNVSPKHAALQQPSEHGKSFN